ncbi:hypothetical protein [Actinomyces trachealis]|uniref:hypothetical protein n=1 Tax=Actinomyces trachealis TaxID=2763540 RepID=UPI001892946B|nr:hypothetical protein [Actinomyces trachealis]
MSDDGTEVLDPYAVVYVPGALGVSAFPGVGGIEASSLRAAWEWAQLPRRDADYAFDVEPYEERLHRLHRLSQTWCAWAGDRVCSVIQVRREQFRPLVHL